MVDYTSTILGVLNGDIALSNPTTPGTTKIASILTSTLALMVEIDAHNPYQTAAKTIVNVIGASTHIASITSHQTLLANFVRHTDLQTNSVTPTEAEMSATPQPPYFRTIMVASSTIETCKDLVSESGALAVPADVIQVSQLSGDDLVSSFSANTVAYIDAQVADLESKLVALTSAKTDLMSEYYMFVEWEMPNPEPTPPPTPPSDRPTDLLITLRDEFKTLSDEFMSILNALLSEMEVRMITDKSTYNTTLPVAEKLTNAGLVFMALNDPNVGPGFSGIV